MGRGRRRLGGRATGRAGRPPLALAGAVCERGKVLSHRDLGGGGGRGRRGAATSRPPGALAHLGGRGGAELERFGMGGPAHRAAPSRGRDRRDPSTAWRDGGETLVHEA